MSEPSEAQSQLTSSNGEERKDMGSYKFRKTQSVPRFDEKDEVRGGPIKAVSLGEVPNDPYLLLESFEKVLIDLTDEKKVGELYDLQSNYEVEDDDATFRLSY
ncbi:glycylpeptide N-tetradecanoyltransferase [Aspergillus hancockii]|nr:glycylpeptide N-tetradecanoyltransferase [Aspergillus hancockii]